MRRKLGARLLALFTGALIGYVFGWIWGWSLFDPNSDVWALAAFVGAVAGLVVGLLPGFWRLGSALIGASLGLYAGWVLRTWLFGDVPGGWGTAVLLAGMLLGGAMAARVGRQRPKARLWTLLGAMYAGFLGGFLIDVVILDVLTGWVTEHSILQQAPAVVMCGIVGGMVGGRLARSRRVESEMDGIG